MFSRLGTCDPTRLPLIFVVVVVGELFINGIETHHGPGQDDVEIEFDVRRILAVEQLEQLRGGLVLGRQQLRRRQYVLQKLDGYILEPAVAIKVLVASKFRPFWLKNKGKLVRMRVETIPFLIAEIGFSVSFGNPSPCFYY